MPRRADRGKNTLDCRRVCEVRGPLSEHLRAVVEGPLPTARPCPHRRLPSVLRCSGSGDGSEIHVESMYRRPGEQAGPTWIPRATSKCPSCQRHCADGSARSGWEKEGARGCDGLSMPGDHFSCECSPFVIVSMLTVVQDFLLSCHPTAGASQLTPTLTPV